MKTVIITGLSGAGKSIAVEALENLGYFCVDNLPSELILKFANLLLQTRGGLIDTAVVCDIRSGDIQNLEKSLLELKESGAEYELLYLSATVETLIKRFKETRRKHPLAKEGSLVDGIKKEREQFEKIKKLATYTVDSTLFSPSKLKEYITELFSNKEHLEKIVINIVSFGFKNGIPIDSDMMFDVRFLPNPYYIPNLKFHTGLDSNVYDFVMQFDETKEFLEKLENMVEYLIPHYIEEGKSHLVISIGCTGGHHRSVTITEALSRYLRDCGHYVITTHRDISKNQ